MKKSFLALILVTLSSISFAEETKQETKKKDPWANAVLLVGNLTLVKKVEKHKQAVIEAVDANAKAAEASLAQTVDSMVTLAKASYYAGASEARDATAEGLKIKESTIKALDAKAKELSSQIVSETKALEEAKANLQKLKSEDVAKAFLEALNDKEFNDAVAKLVHSSEVELRELKTQVFAYIDEAIKTNKISFDYSDEQKEEWFAEVIQFLKTETAKRTNQD
jgi:hypothetical protein